MYRLWTPSAGFVFEDGNGFFKRSRKPYPIEFETPYSDMAHEFRRVMQRRCPGVVYYVVRMK